ncbi:MAG: phage terminase large subunit family protein [Candidatus Bathyarchaeota archaeon]|nr:phage terminase large subunit family protein [Candidatus Bathyarchaeota archaeon]
MNLKPKRRGLETLLDLKSEYIQIGFEHERVSLPPPSDPVEWTKEYRILKGKPFSFQDRDYLFPIYRDTSHRIVIVKSRQMEMTEWIVNWLLIKLTNNPFTTGIYTAPRMDQVSRFSQDRFRAAILDSEKLREYLLGRKRRDEKLGEPAITRIPFSNGSVCYLVSAWGDFGAIRNIPADFIAVDEMQDVQGEAVPVIEECMSHSSYGFMIAVGTASDEGDQFSKLWEESDKKEWNKNAWIQQKPENKFYSGYHIDQRMASWIINLPPEHPNSLEAKRQRYSERRYMNEVLGLFYRGLAKPLIPDDMLKCVDRTLDNVSRLDPPYQSYAGIDWGGGEFAFTVIWIMALDELERWRLLYCHKFDEKDPMKQVQTIGKMIEGFNVKQAVADIGYGAVQVSELQKRFGDRVYGCQYIRNPAMPLQRVQKDEFGKRIAQLMVQADRSFWIEKAIQIIKKKDRKGESIPDLVIPWNENVARENEWIIDHFCCIEMEEQETVSGKKYHHYTHPEGEPDDALHSFIYALIGDAIGRLTPDLVIQDLFE